MQFKIGIQETADGWQVQIRNSTTDELILADPRKLRRLGHGLQAVPLPPEKELVEPTADSEKYKQLCHTLCTASDVRNVIEVYGKIVNRAPNDGDMQAFGSYLFTTLIGNDAWQKIQAMAGKGPLELALTWQSSQLALNRLPWEMMHGPDDFLAKMPKVAITRRVAGTTREPDVIRSQPRILFVIGTDIGNDVIRPGTEYLNLIRILQQTGPGIKTHVLYSASIEKLKAVMKWFKPTIVHFICHGVFQDETSYLKLMDDDKPNSEAPFLANADNLLVALSPDDLPLPTIVVLSACSTANTVPIFQEAGQLATPLAVELVRGNIPIVVGMAGEVSDQACRLFSRCFFEALLQKGDIAQAVAEGRRGGIMTHSDPKTSVDWALPTLYLSEAIKESRVAIELPQPILDLNSIAEQFLSEDYPTFCDRLELLQWCDLLMADTNIQENISSRQSALQVLAIAVNTPPGTRWYGRTRLLEEIAAHAVRNGHVPCLLKEKDIVPYPPKTFEDLLQTLNVAANLKTARRFGLNTTWKYIPQLQQLAKGQPLSIELPEELRAAYSTAKQDPMNIDVIATAFRLDLLRFLEKVCKTRTAEEQNRAMLLLLIDDVEMMGCDVVEKLLYLFKDSLRLPPAQKRVRVVFTYSMQGDSAAVNAINSWIRAKWVEPIHLNGFSFRSSPTVARLAYQQFLLNWREGNGNGPKFPLTLATRAEIGDIKQFFRRMDEATQQGIPFYLNGRDVLREVQGYLNFSKEELGYELLIEANDEVVLKTLRGH